MAKTKIKEHLYAIGKKIATLDGWKNILTGINVAGKDKRLGAEPFHRLLMQGEIETIYAGDDVAKKIINKIPFDGTRKWIELTNGETEEKNKINEELKRLKTKKICKKAWVYGRLYGGAAIFLVTDDLASDDNIAATPLIPEKVTKIENLIVLNRYELMPDTNLTKKLDSPNFGLPDAYALSTNKKTGLFKIHHSRLIRFEGSPLGEQMFESNQYWHDSVLSAIHQILVDYSSANSSIATVLTDFRQMVYKYKGLAEKMANPETEDQITNRISMMNLVRSVLSIIVIDGEEEIEDRTMTLTGLKDVITPVQNRTVVASGLPHTVILGDSPTGLGATGKSEESIYYDEIGSLQEANLRSPLEIIINIIKNYLSITNNIGFDFVPLKQKTEKEDAEIKELMSKADEKYIDTGVLTPEEVALSRFGGEKYSTNTEINKELRENSKDLSEE